MLQERARGREGEWRGDKDCLLYNYDVTMQTYFIHFAPTSLLSGFETHVGE